MPLRTVFACLACATALPLRGRAQQPLTLQEAVALAQERGLDAQAARAARDAGRYRYQAFRARLLPQLSLGGLGLPSYHRGTGMKGASAGPVKPPPLARFARPTRGRGSS